MNPSTSYVIHVISMYATDGLYFEVGPINKKDILQIMDELWETEDDIPDYYNPAAVDLNQVVHWCLTDPRTVRQTTYGNQ